MRVLTIAISVFAAVAAAHPFPGVPHCADATLNALVTASGCGNDVVCFCKNPTATADLKTKLLKSCNPDEAARAVKVVTTTCKNSGVDITGTIKVNI